MAQVAIAAAATVAVSLLSRVLSPQPKPSIADLSITSGAYGDSIPIAYGDVRVQANLIWSNGWKHVNGANSKLGGKGKSSTKGVQVETANLGFSICEGPITGVKTIWANGIIIYDASNTYKDPQTGKIIGTGQYAFRFYLGNTYQTPDAMIQLYTDGANGANSTPGYRDLAYFTVQGMNLTKWGNSIPTFHVEVTKAGQPNLPFIEATGLSNPEFDDSGYSNILFDWQNETMYVFDQNGITSWDVSYPDVQIGQATYAQIGIPAADITGAFRIRPETACLCTGKFIVMSCYHADSSETVYVIDENSLTLVKTINFPYSPIRAMYGFVVPSATTAFTNCVWGLAGATTYFILNVDTGEVLFAQDSVNFVIGDDAGTFSDATPGFFLVLPPDVSGVTNSQAQAVIIPNITNTSTFTAYLVTLSFDGTAFVTLYFKSDLSVLGLPLGAQASVQSAAIDLTDGGVIIQATSGSSQAIFKIATNHALQATSTGAGIASSQSTDVGALEAAGVGQDNNGPPGGA